MEYLTTAEAAERWGITARRVQTIPVNAEKPEDPRHVRRTEQKDSY